MSEIGTDGHITRVLSQDPDLCAVACAACGIISGHTPIARARAQRLAELHAATVAELIADGYAIRSLPSDLEPVAALAVPYLFDTDPQPLARACRECSARAGEPCHPYCSTNLTEIEGD